MSDTDETLDLIAALVRHPELHRNRVRREVLDRIRQLTEDRDVEGVVVEVEEPAVGPEGETQVELPEPPPLEGAGSGVKAWRQYAADVNVEVDPKATREEVIQALKGAGILPPETETFEIDCPVASGDGWVTIDEAPDTVVSAGPAEGQPGFTVTAAPFEGNTEETCLTVSDAPLDVSSVRITVTATVPEA